MMPEPVNQEPKMNYRWTRITQTAVFPPRDGVGALVYKNAMWLIGNHMRRDVWKLERYS